MAANGQAPALDCDLLVVGGGAAACRRAVTAAYHGLKVVVAEKAPVLGGATSWSGGWMWAPLNPLSQADGIVEDVDAPRTYLKHALGENYDEPRVEALLENARHMVAFFEKHTSLQFVSRHAGSPTSRATCPGPAPAAGRSGPSRSTRGGSEGACGRSCARSSTRPRSSAWASWPAPTCRRSCTPRRR